MRGVHLDGLLDAAAWVLPKKLRKLLTTRLGYDQLASDLASLQALDDTEAHRALLSNSAAAETLLGQELAEIARKAMAQQKTR